MKKKTTNLKQASQKNPNPVVLVEMATPEFDPYAVIENFTETGEPAMVFERNGQTTVVVKPKKVLRINNGQLYEKNGHNQTFLTSDQPIETLKKRFDQTSYQRLEQGPFFQQGLIGYFAYDFARYSPDVHLKKVENERDLVDADLFLPDVVITYQEEEAKLTLTKVIEAEERPQDVEKELVDYGQNICKISKRSASQANTKGELTFSPRFSMAAFEKRVKEAKAHIVQGDIFQLILSNPLTAETTGQLDMLSFGRQLRAGDPSPYHFYFRDGDFQVLGASPETLIKKTGAQLFSYPLAGTRRRGRTAEEEERFEKELQNSQKEQAEHNMLVDLGRNDLGRVSEFGTVRVTALQRLLKFPNVMHLGSTIESQAKKQLNPIDLVLATLPAGTLSGAPKISAMQIINKLEGQKRGIYGGGIGTLDFNGDVDLAIGIRMVYQKGEQVVIHSGAGIVADSKVEEEYLEFHNKSALMMNLLGGREMNHDTTNR
ncbi:Anthranilate/para-aminobenzoate synthases component I (TrpE) [Fructobacillus fructosus]|uniref:anthranilate synthase component I family protein n=1 Tax=Fructobacillus fructosus TaxID=1631 RepID=UPI00021940C8|nr:anthranilate synthase component I family protein [Fructobacillus fructosus]KRN52029.1 Anthranilate synthase [Fructobacillus fructosus KCTC 3544]GAP01623.1 chorismate binding enzyme [Fructobacillus fructosus]CAK1242546.1 Anthranilate/para-aminobenzoate synthases component I (TrpE) [Fructobacillus fructosus]